MSQRRLTHKKKNSHRASLCSQMYTRCWETHTACPALCPLNTTTSGTLSARRRGARTTCPGVPPPLATTRPRNGASVRYTVKKTQQEMNLSGQITVRTPLLLHHRAFSTLSLSGSSCSLLTLTHDAQTPTLTCKQSAQGPFQLPAAFLIRGGFL